MYLRLKFENVTAHFNTIVSTKSISQWIKEVITGQTLIANLPSSNFDIANCVIEGSLPSNIVASFNTYTGATTSSQVLNNHISFTKAHSQNSNFVDIFRIYQNQYYSQGFLPRILSSNGTNSAPDTPNTSSKWIASNQDSGSSMTHGLAGAEFQFFISPHWVIWNTIDALGRGGNAGIFEVESTGQDVWANSINSLCSPQILITAYGTAWPSSTTLRVTEGSVIGYASGIYANQMYNGEASFINKGGFGYGNLYWGANQEYPMIFPDPQQSFVSTRDEIGDTQNYMIPVYFHTTTRNSSLASSSRATLTGRIPFLWRTTDNAAQTGQKATVSGTEYRFVRMHGCGANTTSSLNAATYMVPTLIGGI
jgi:hypothetical protein